VILGVLEHRLAKVSVLEPFLFIMLYCFLFVFFAVQSWLLNANRQIKEMHIYLGFSTHFSAFLTTAMLPRMLTGEINILTMNRYLF